MTEDIDGPPIAAGWCLATPAAPPAEVPSAASAWLGWLGMLAVFAAAIALRHLVAANTDVSWLLIAGDRMLDGAHLYSDIIETNPPMAVLIYVPALLIARALGFPAEIVVDALMFA